MPGIGDSLKRETPTPTPGQKNRTPGNSDSDSLPLLFVFSLWGFWLVHALALCPLTQLGDCRPCRPLNFSFCPRYYGATACNATRGIAKAFLSVRLSKACIMTKRKYHNERTFILVFQHEEWLVGGDDSLYLKFWTKLARSSKNVFQSIFARSISAVTPSEKSSINTNRKSTFDWY